MPTHPGKAGLLCALFVLERARGEAFNWMY